MRFDIERFEVQGNTLLKPEAVGRLVAPFTGKQRDFSDVQRALEALEVAYRDAGYGVVQVTLPEQNIAAGTINLNFPTMTAGGYAVNGTAGILNVTSPSNSGFFVSGGAPLLNQNLFITYSGVQYAPPVNVIVVQQVQQAVNQTVQQTTQIVNNTQQSLTSNASDTTTSTTTATTSAASEAPAADKTESGEKTRTADNAGDKSSKPAARKVLPICR